MRNAVIITAIIGALIPSLVQAQAPSDVEATILAEGGDYGPCLLTIAYREDPPLILDQPNLEGSGAMGLFQFMPPTWFATPIGKRVALGAASAAQQTAAAVWTILFGQGIGAWAPVPAACLG